MSIIQIGNVKFLYKTGVIPKSLSVLSTEPVLRKAAVDRGLRFSTGSTNVDRGTTSLNAL